MTTVEAGKRLGVGTQRVRDLIENGRLKAQKYGRDWMIEESEVASFKRGKPGRPKKNRGRK